MHTARLLIDCWESSGSAPRPWRAVALLKAEDQVPAFASLAEMPVGARDARLLELRRKLFGERMEALARCPECGAMVELEFAVSDILAPAPETAQRRVELDQRSIEFRLPNSHDIAAVASEPGVEEARDALLRRCVQRVRRGRHDSDLDDAPPQLIALMEEAMARADPMADIVIEVRCAACEATWQASFEADSFVEAEVSAGAKRLLEEVHVIARAYGWTEGEILGLPSRRRQAYLELVSAE